MIDKMKCQNADCCFQWKGKSEMQVNKSCPHCGNRNLRVEKQKEV